MQAVSAPETVKLGQAGGTVIQAGAAVTNDDPGWAMFQVITDAVLTEVTVQDLENDGDLTGVTLKAGLVIFGKFTRIWLDSGLVIAYKSA